MQDTILKGLKGELVNGYAKKRHPFRYFTLATVYEGLPKQRTVVLRKMLHDFEVLFYTDLRSQKVKDIKANSAVSALFYHPKKMMQVQLEGHAKCVTDKDELNTYWKAIPESSRKDYITKLAPGTYIKNPDHVDYNPEDAHFCAIKIIPEAISFLQLQRPHHLRLQYTKVEGQWQGQFLVP